MDVSYPGMEEVGLKEKLDIPCMLSFNIKRGVFDVPLVVIGHVGISY